jgi:hypothetical protein
MGQERQKSQVLPEAETEVLRAKPRFLSYLQGEKPYLVKPLIFILPKLVIYE